VKVETDTTKMSGKIVCNTITGRRKQETATTTEKNPWQGQQKKQDPWTGTEKEVSQENKVIGIREVSFHVLWSFL